MAGAPERPFLFDRSRRTVRDGETLLHALGHGRWPVVQRSIRYHRPRGPACGLGYCTGCLVRVNGRPNVRACRYEPNAGDVVTTENSWPSPRFDLLGALDFLFPSGIDTLHGFRRPAWATRAYHRVVRRLAGFGAVPDPPPKVPPLGPVRRSVDVAIVGAGTAGRAVAAGLVAAGHRPLLVDRSLHPPPVPGADLLGRTTITFLPPPAADGDGRFTLLGFEEPERGVEVRARRVVVATGGYDAALLFGGNDRPGVVTADGAFALLDHDDRLPFERAVVVGGGDRVDAVLTRFGDAVAGVVAPGGIAPAVVRRASEQGIPLYPRSLVLSAAGRSRVRSLSLRSRGGGARFTLACDAVVLAHRRLPTPQLFFQAGARMEWRAGTAAYHPVLSSSAETTVSGLYAVGATAGVLPEAAATASERVVAGLLGRAAPDGGPIPRVSPDGPSELEGYYRELLAEPRSGRWVACPCEDVLLSEVEEAHGRGYRGIEVIKRYSGLGTGLCQGRYCLPDALLLLSLLEERPPPDVGYITQRPPVVPTPLSAFAALAEPAPPAEAT
jgi:sarcosine oxidase, subunit alpha